MREITEAQAQELANLSGCCVTQCEVGPASMWAPGDTPNHGIGIQWGTPYGTRLSLKIRVSTDRPWDEAIWRPE